MEKRELGQIFISYGRRDASQFAGRLAEDLTRQGYKVWRDTSDLDPGRVWDDQIVNAIKSSSAVIAILTPHAVRTGPSPSAEESVCLDELAVARFRSPPTPIVPVMLIPCEPPFSIYRVHYIDFQGADANDARYSEAFKELTGTIEAVTAGQRLPPRTVGLQPLDFDLYLKGKSRDFVGREWLVRKLSTELSADEARTILLVAEPGWGKTAFAGHLFATNPDGLLLAGHFCRADRADTIDARRLVESLAAMAGLRLPAYGEKLSHMLNEDPMRAARGETEMFERYFLGPMASLDVGMVGRGPRYLLVDGLDEAVSATGTASIPRLLARQSQSLPAGLCLVATTRDAFGIVESFPSAKVIRLGRDDPQNRSDIVQVIARRLKPSERERAASNVDTTLLQPILVRAIDAKAGGNALVASQLATAVRNSGLDADVIEALPNDLSALYRTLLERRFDPRGSEWAQVRDVLEMVMATDSALPITLAAQARGDMTEYDTRAAVDRISDLLVNQGDAIQFFHLTFRDFLSTKVTPFFVNQVPGASRLADFSNRGFAQGRVSPDVSDFCRENATSWILKSKDMASYGHCLVPIYELVLERRRFSGWVGSDHLTEEDRRIIHAFASAGQGDHLVEVSRFAFGKADREFHESGANAWISRERTDPPAEEESRLIGQKLFKTFGATGFAIEWTSLLIKLAPQYSNAVLLIMRKADRLSTLFDWLDYSSGWRSLGRSQMYEDMGTAASQEWSKLARAVSSPAGRT